MSSNLKSPMFLYGFTCLALAMLSACPSSSSDSTAKGDAVAGKAAVMKYACMSCHGTNLAGSTTVYPGTMAYAANLTPDKDTGLGDWDAATIKTAILTGKDDEGKQLCSTMPKFTDMKMTDTEATDVVAYLKSLAAVKKEVPESECGSGAAGSAAAGTSGSAGAAGK